MTDDEVEKIIWDEFQKRDVIYLDMIGLPNCGVDPDPEDNMTTKQQRIRSNRFSEIMGSQRMKELLCAGEYNPGEDCPPLKISFQDLFRFWWNRCVVQEYVVDEVLEDLFDYFTALMAPPEKKEEGMDMTIDFDKMPLFPPGLEQAA